MQQLTKDMVQNCIDRLKFEFPYSADEWIDKDMVMENYHKHTYWSNLVQIDSATSVEEFMRKLDEYGCRYYFSGEHGYQGEWLKMYDICKSTQDEGIRAKMGIKSPISFRYSVEAYWVKDSSISDDANCHMVIVARTYNAMRKLNYLISCAHTDGFYRKPRIDLKQLFKFDKDEIFITSACVAGWKYEDAIGIWLDIWGHFGDSFFLEYQANNTDRQKEVNRKILELRRMYGIQTIIGLDTHYISNEDEIKRNNLLIRKKINYPEEEGWYMDFPNGVEAYKRMIEQKIVPPDEIILSMMNTHVFSTLCEDITYDTGFKIPILDQYRLLDYEERADILKGILKERFEGEDYEHLTDDRYEGMMYEFGEIKDSGTVDYFIDNTLLVGLAVKKYNGQLTTTSRGSASSYYSSKLLGFTTMDRFEAEVPIYPERFITKERILSSHQMPDIDFNVSDQQPFVSAARELFGEHGCYPLLAVGTLGEKSGFKLYADIAGIEPSIANDISKCIDQYNEDLKNAEDDDDKNAINIEDYILNEEHLRIFNDSKSYQGIVEQPKVHACGFMLFNGNIRQEDVVGYGDIRYEIGLIRCVSKSNSKSTIVANIEGGLLDSYGYVKDDFLIVDVVGIIYKLYHAINREVPTVSELRKMVTGDEPTWKMYEMGATCSLNQCEKPSTTKKVMKYKPRNIKELAAFIAGIRPGFKSLIEGFLSRIDYTNGEPAIDELLKDCFHYMLYQEAVMKIFSWLGIPMKDSYDTIKKISKKKLKGEALKHVEDTLMEHWMSNIGNLDNFEPVYKVIKDSARYSFNAPHALAMANDSLYEAWMKAHHMSVFYEVTLNHYKQKGDKDKVADLIREATTMFGYTMAEYEYGKDNSKFVIDDDTKTINPSLSSVKGIGAKAVGDMYAISQRGVNDFLDIYGSIKGTNINASIFQNLVKIGYFRKFGSIKKLLKAIEIYDYWKGSNGEGRKTISKANLPEFGLENIDIRKYATDIMMSGKVSTKQFTNVDWKGIAKELVSMIPDEEFGILQLVKFQYEVLGYTNYTDNDVEWRYVLVTNLDTAYSPKFRAYSINNGKIVEMKVHKTINKRDKIVKSSFKETPFEEGDILYIRNVKKQPKQQKVDDKWVDIPNTTEWWIKDYYKVV